MHATDANTLRRTYKSLQGHVDALRVEAAVSLGGARAVSGGGGAALSARAGLPLHTHNSH